MLVVLMLWFNPIFPIFLAKRENWACTEIAVGAATCVLIQKNSLLQFLPPHFWVKIIKATASWPNGESHTYQPITIRMYLNWNFNLLTQKVWQWWQVLMGWNASLEWVGWDALIALRPPRTNTKSIGKFQWASWPWSTLFSLPRGGLVTLRSRHKAALLNDNSRILE